MTVSGQVHGATKDGTNSLWGAWYDVHQQLNAAHDRIAVLEGTGGRTVAHDEGVMTRDEMRDVIRELRRDVEGLKVAGVKENGRMRVGSEGTGGGTSGELGGLTKPVGSHHHDV